MHRITPFLWFDSEAEEAARFYISIFDDSGIDALRRYGEAGPGQPGSVMAVDFHLRGQPFIALNGGPHHDFSPAVSFFVHTRDQTETDRYWNALLADGGEALHCGWLTDRFGLTWQVVPDRLDELTQLDDADAVRRVTEAMLKMVKIDIEALERAARA